MAFTIPSLAATREFLVAAFKALFPDRNVGTRFTYHGRRLTVLSAAVTQLHRHVDSVGQDVMPDTASDDGPIDRWGTIVGTVRKPATPGRKAQALRVRGTVGATAAIGDELIHQSSGLRFELASSVVIPASPLYVDADVVAIDVGSKTRLSKDEVLEFVATPANIETQAVLVKAIDEDGFDQEQYGAYRKRVLDTFSAPTAGGTQSDYEKWALEIDGITTAKAYPNRAGFGTVDVAILHTGSGSARIPSGGMRSDALAFLKTKAPAHIAGTPGSLRVLTPIADPQKIEIRIQANGERQYAFDWSDDDGFTVAAYAARSVQFNATLPPSLKAGHRLCFGSASSAQDGKEFKIEAITAADTVLLEVAPDVDPVAGDQIYSGGPLVTPVRSAILAHVNGEIVYGARGGVPKSASQLADEGKTIIGLEVIADGVATANPIGKYGSWNGGLLLDTIRHITMAKTGVRRVTLAHPTIDYDAIDYGFPNDSQIGLVTSLAVLVRKL